MPENHQESEISYPARVFLRDVFSYIRPYRRRFIVASLLRLTGDIAHLYPAYALAAIVTFLSGYSRGGSLRPFWVLFGLWTAATLWRAFSVYTGKYLAYQISERSGLDVVLAALRRLFALDLAWHERENAGNKLKLIQRAGSALDRVVRMWINNYIEIFVNFVGITIVLWRIDRTIGLSLLGFVAVYFTLATVLTRRAYKVVREVNLREEEVSGLIFQAINNIRSVKVMDIGPKLFDLISAETAGLFSRIKDRIFRFQSRGAILSVWTTVFRFGAFTFIVLGIARGRLDVGFLILFNIYFLRLTESAAELAETAQDLVINKFALGRLRTIYGHPVKDGSSDGAVPFPAAWQKITVNDLSFSYGIRPILHNVNFEIARGERIGIVGLSGAGKSTLFKLLLKENEDFTGRIEIDGVPLDRIDKKSYYRQVGVVLQDTEVFNFSLRDNITISADAAADERKLGQALAIAHVSDYVHKLPHGLDTAIGEKGVKLSGGERQRLGIARAIYKEPQILFLDEATSHLDLESEEKIRDSLHTFLQSVTAVVIAHRLTTIRELDRILVFERGRLIESGSFDALHAQKGRFYELWEKQNFSRKETDRVRSASKPKSEPLPIVSLDSPDTDRNGA